MKTKTPKEGAPTPAVFAAQDNFALEQLRLENLWLRQQLHARAKLRPRPRVDGDRQAA